MKTMLLFLVLLLGTCGVPAEVVPALPTVSGTVEIPAQSWPHAPGDRKVKVHIRYPGDSGALTGVRGSTGLMLSLHNWGGQAFVGTADPQVLADEYDVVAIGVDYLQSGREAALNGPPYDHGYLQALDALRALQFVFEGLRARQVEFESRRIFATGGSGGGNVTLMCNKLAPRTFACVIDLCGMKKLSDDVAFNLPGGSTLNARYSRNPADPFYLSPAMQEIRFAGHPEHLRQMRKLGNRAKIITVHGTEDVVCPYPDAVEFVDHSKRAGFDIKPWFLTRSMLDGKVFTDAGHPLGNRTLIVGKVAGGWLKPNSWRTLRRRGLTDFERREEIRYSATGGTWVIDYSRGWPVGRFEAAR